MSIKFGIDIYLFEVYWFLEVLGELYKLGGKFGLKVKNVVDCGVVKSNR